MLQMNLSIKQLDRMCIITIVVSTLICGYLAVSHLNKKKMQFRIEKDILSKRMNEASFATANLKDLKTALSETQSELNYLNKKIPAAGEIGTFLKQLNALMRQRRVNMISLQPQAAVQEKNYLKIPIHLLFTGNFANIFELMNDIEQMNRIVIMDHMMINRQETMQQCQAELRINVFERATIN